MDFQEVTVVEASSPKTSVLLTLLLLTTLSYFRGNWGKQVPNSFNHFFKSEMVVVWAGEYSPGVQHVPSQLMFHWTS